MYGKCSDTLVFPERIILTPRELQLSLLAKTVFQTQLSAIGRYTIYYPFRGNYRITQNFSASHKGTDWGLPNTTPLYCMFPSGEVTFTAKTTDGYAWNIRIVDTTQGLMSLYAHMPDINPFKVKVGDKVTWQDIVGWSDNTGNSTGPHLHCEVRGGPYYAYSSAFNYLSEIDSFPTTPLPPTPLPIPFEYPVIPTLPTVKTTVIVTKWLNVRALPNEYSMDLGDLFPGQICDVYGYETDSAGNIWFAIKKDKLIGWCVARYKSEIFLQVIK